MENNITNHSEEVGYSTNRGISEYASLFGFRRDEFLSWMSKHKRILDIGSGGGLLAKEIDLLKKQGVLPKSKVFSIDLVYGFKKGRDEEKYSTQLAFTRNGIKADRNQIDNHSKNFRKNAIGASFTRMPLASNSIDAVFASYSFGIHSTNFQMLLSAYLETARVLKKGGEGFISVSVDDKDEGILRTGNRFSPVFYKLNQISFLRTDLRFTKQRQLDDSQLTEWFLYVQKV